MAAKGGLHSCRPKGLHDCQAAVGLVGGKRGVAGKTPHKNVLLKLVPAQGGIVGGGLAEQLVVPQTVRGRVLREKHGHSCLVHGQLEGQPWMSCQPGTQIAIPCLGPGREVHHRAFAPCTAGVGPTGRRPSQRRGI